MKKYVIYTATILIIVTIIVLYKTVNLGALTVSVFEHVANVDIEYQEIKGNILRGFKIKEYVVRLSETDSICGRLADIKYRFNPLLFRLPNRFEINLIDPVAYIKESKRDGGTGIGRLPNLALGLRLNLKNGTLIYQNEKMYTAEGISGLIFLDFVGPKIYLTTVNLSLKIKENPIIITSTNLSMAIDRYKVETKSFKIRGSGFDLDGKGHYLFKDRYATLNIKSAEVDLGKFGIYNGILKLTGDVEHKNGNFMPRLRGNVEKMFPFDRFDFETNASNDTIWINIFDGKLLGGNLFAQVEILGLKNVQFETNFNELNMSDLTNAKVPMIVNGCVAFRQNRFKGIINSPADKGLGIDSLWLFGSIEESQILLDSLYVLEGRKIIEVSGKISSRYDLSIYFDEYNLEGFSKYFPVKGILNGNIHIDGDTKDPKDIDMTGDLRGINVIVGDTKFENFHLNAEKFKLDNGTGFLSTTVENFAYEKFTLDVFNLHVKDNKYSVYCKRLSDSLLMDGILDRNLKGTLESIYIEYNGVITKNIEPINFDLVNKKIGDIRLSFIDGVLEMKLLPLYFRLSHGNLQKLGAILGLKDSLSGVLEIIFDRNRLNVESHEINYVGLKNGHLIVAGLHKNQGIFLDSLIIFDDHDQGFSAEGFISLRESRISTKFRNVDVWVLPFLKNFLGNPKGLMTGAIKFEGNLEDYQMTGGGEIKNGCFTIAMISSKFDSVESNVRFAGDRIIFESGRGIISPINGTDLSSQKIDAAGIVKLEPRFRVNDLDFDFSFKDAPIQFRPFVYGVGSGNFSIEMNEGITHFNGNITAKEAIVPIDFGMKFREDKSGDNNWRMRLKLKGERNIWLRNRDADIEFKGELQLIKEEGPVYLSGVLETSRGNYYWLNHVLTITQGKVTFIPWDRIDPELDFWAEMNTREGVKIVLHLFGPISEPIFEFFTEPPGQYSEQDIITYLNLNITFKELELIKQGEYVGRILPHGLLSWLEADISRLVRQHTGVDYFRIETPFFEPDERTKLTVGKYISKKLFIKYTYDITSFSNEFNVEYFIDDNNEILIKKDETGEYNMQYQYRIRF